MSFKFEKLIIWQKAMDLGEKIRSLAEIVTCIHKAKRHKYITSKEFDLLYEESFNLMNMMVGFKRKIE